MLIDGNIITLFGIDQTTEFRRLREHCLNYDWYLDPILLKLAGNDIAFKDCRVIHNYTSELIQHIKKHRNNFDYANDTKNLIVDVNSVIDLISLNFENHYLLKWHVVSLIPKGSQKKHADTLFYHSYARRICIPIITSADAHSHIGDEIFNLTQGIVYEKNNRVPHYSENCGDQIRTFLFMDVIPNSLLDSVKKYYNFNDVIAKENATLS